MIFKKTNI